MDLVGKSVPKVDGWEKVTGQAIYATDIKLPGILYAKALRSPYPHAGILNIDTSCAEKLIGVRAVATGSDPLLRPSGGTLNDRYCLALGKVRFIGEPVAAVAAMSEEVADEGLSLIDVEYEPLEPIFDAVKIVEEGAPLIHEHLGSYQHLPWVLPVSGAIVCHHFRLRKGDVQKGFAESDLVLEQEYTCQKIQHCPLEVHNAVAKQ